MSFRIHKLKFNFDFGWIFSKVQFSGGKLMGRCLLFLLLLLGCRDFLLTFLASAALSTSADDGILTSFLLGGKRSTNDKKENRIKYIFL